MKTIILITYLGSNLLSQATYDTMDSCMVARESMLKQPQVQAFCVYRDKRKEIDPSSFFRAFEEMMKNPS